MLDRQWQEDRQDRLDKEQRERHERQAPQDRIDRGLDSLFYASMAGMGLFGGALILFILWATGSMIWEGFTREFAPWPGIVMSLVWTLTGALAFAAAFWALFKIGSLVRYFAEQKWRTR